MNRILRYFLLYGLIFLAIMGIFSSLNNPNPKMKPIRMTNLSQRWNKEKLKMQLFSRLQLVYEVKGEMEGYEKGETFVTNIPENDDAQCIGEIVKTTSTEIDILTQQKQAHGYRSLQDSYHSSLLLSFSSSY